MKIPPLILGFSKKDNQKVKAVLKKLLKHLNLKNVTLVGGLAIRHQILKEGHFYPKRSFNDLDLVVKSPKDVYKSVCSDFLIYHYHPLKNSHFYIVLLDPKHKIKIDIFDNSTPPIKPETVVFNNLKLKIRSCEDQLTRTVLDLLKVTKNEEIDPKQFSDAKLLLKIAPSQTLNQQLNQAEEIVKKSPKLLLQKPFHKPKPYKCSACVKVKSFPITPMENIYQILGYVE